MKRLSIDELRAKYGISQRVVNEMVRGGFVERGARDHLFSFQDIQLLRMVQDLYTAGISPVRTARFLEQLRERSGTFGRLAARGGELVVREGLTLRTPTGQLVIDFEERGVATVRALRRPVQAGPPEKTAQEWFLAALYAETADPGMAQACYENAIGVDPSCADAYINLCCLLVERQDWSEAKRLCERAIEQCPTAPLLHYNLSVVLEEHGDYHAALTSYRRALELDPELADAHHNLGILLDTMGERVAAIRHLREYRKLN